MNLFIGSGKIHYQFVKNNIADLLLKESIAKQSVTEDTFYRMDVELLDANPNAEVIRGQKQNYVENYYTFANSGDMTTVFAYDRITYRDIYPGVDWVLYIQNNKLKHEFIVREGADPSKIRMHYSGASRLSVNDGGGLTAVTPIGCIYEEAPVSYQRDGKVIQTSYALENNTVTYKLAQFSGPLVIDPSLSWATYYGGSGDDPGLAMTLDRFGNTYPELFIKR